MVDQTRAYAENPLPDQAVAFLKDNTAVKAINYDASKEQLSVYGGDSNNNDKAKMLLVLGAKEENITYGDNSIVISNADALAQTIKDKGIEFFGSKRLPNSNGAAIF